MQIVRTFYSCTRTKHISDLNTLPYMSSTVAVCTTRVLVVQCTVRLVVVYRHDDDKERNGGERGKLLQ